MALSMKRDLDNETKLFTALGFSEKQTSEPFLESARADAYGHGLEQISINSAGQAVVAETIDGRQQAPAFIDFANSEVSLPMSMKYDVVQDGKVGHVDLSKSIFGSHQTFDVKADDKVIHGSCSTKQGVTECDETIQDTAGKVLLKGHTVADIYKNPSDFQRTTSFKNADDVALGTVKQHVQFNQQANTVNAETWVTRVEK